MRCLACKKADGALQRCGACRAVLFCDRECQRAAWKDHRALCGVLSKHVPPKGIASSVCLIVDGLGPCGPGWEVGVGQLERQLSKASVTAVTVDATEGKEIPFQIASLLSQQRVPSGGEDSRSSSSKNVPLGVDSLVMLGWGSGEEDLAREFGESDGFRDAVRAWVAAGGRFIVQGERMAYACGDWPKWFDKRWSNGDYFRTDHVCFAEKQQGGGDDCVHWCKWYEGASGSVTGTYNVKAVMAEDVPAEETLFGTTDDSRSHSLVPFMAGRDIGPGQAAVAYGRFGEGTVSFFGDVNFEEPTLRIMSIIARGN